ncbi:hypothetical protein QMK17_22350 [Rhodococcus sp. G-MC3]|uniref:hypothetical protein n=1 Tax=Rhodococcus sp. G-MC3 TaxID=3046209 RepID=UPI0024BBB39E|nr:hypothetical protein [Rhodococcus sp. G-MC3]MDJ0396068.1 hypothetical protein [Rhodococcus sp. G-MC3]
MSSERLYRPTGFEEMIDELVVRARRLVVTGERRLLGITGPPGSGKTTVCDALAAHSVPRPPSSGWTDFIWGTTS